MNTNLIGYETHDGMRNKSYSLYLYIYYLKIKKHN